MNRGYVDHAANERRFVVPPASPSSRSALSWRSYVFVARDASAAIGNSEQWHAFGPPRVLRGPALIVGAIVLSTIRLVRTTRLLDDPGEPSARLHATAAAGLRRVLRRYHAR
jgi:hypothetical protein